MGPMNGSYQSKEASTDFHNTLGELSFVLKDAVNGIRLTSFVP